MGNRFSFLDATGDVCRSTSSGNVDQVSVVTGAFYGVRPSERNALSISVPSISTKMMRLRKSCWELIPPLSQR